MFCLKRSFCFRILVAPQRASAGTWGSPKPIHLKPGHLKMAFFTARCRLDSAFPAWTAPCLSRRCFPCGISIESAVRIDVSSANFRAKFHFQVRTSERSPIFRCPPLRCPPLVGHTPSTAGTFRKKFRKNSGKTPETLSERFLEFPSGVLLGYPKPYNSRHLRLPEHFQNSLPPSTAGDASFFRSGSGEGLSEPGMEFLGRPQGLRPLPTLELQKFGNCGKSENRANPASENQCTIIFEFVPGFEKSSLFAASIPGSESWLF